MPTTAAKRIDVAVGVILRNGQCLVSKRASDAHQGGLWEFPGGKLEPTETAEQALARELHEELGIKVSASRPLLEIEHDYGDRAVKLWIRTVSEFTGEAVGRENQPLRWVPIEALGTYEFPEANKPIIERLLKPL